MTGLQLTEGQDYYTARFSADISNLKDVVDGALAYFDRKFSQMDEDSRLELKIILNELLINAVKHGGRNDPGCMIETTAGMISEDCACLIVEDCGEGYDAGSIQRIGQKIRQDGCIGDLDEISETGRGILIVKSLCDGFTVNDKGNRVEIIKKLRKPEKKA